MMSDRDNEYSDLTKKTRKFRQNESLKVSVPVLLGLY